MNHAIGNVGGEGMTCDSLIAALGLQAHPEGGFYAETFRSPLLVNLPDGRVRAASTAIYFLLPSGTFSAMHRVAADEGWHHYGGASLELVTINPEGVLERVLLGRSLQSGERPHHMVPAGFWQGARPLGEGYALAGCTVAPGFDFADFEMPGRSELGRLFPQHAVVLEEFTHPAGT